MQVFMMRLVIYICGFFITQAEGLKTTLFNSWTCVGLHRGTDWTVPQRVQIGDLPLVLWSSGPDPAKDRMFSMLNICKHMGSRLDQGTVTDDCKLKCPYHGLEFSGTKDGFGQAVVHEGKVFWSYRPTQSRPPSTPFYHHPGFVTSSFEMDMPASLTDSAYNAMDVHHPEYVHRWGFGSSVPPTNLQHYRYTDRDGVVNRIGLAFDYVSSELMQAVNQHKEPTRNFHMYKFPSFTWSRVSLRDRHLLISLHLCPLAPDMTRWYVTLCHNYHTSSFGQETMKLMAMVILGQDHVQMHQQVAENPLKSAWTFQNVLPQEDAVWWLREMMSAYQYPDIKICEQLLREHQDP